MKLIKYLLLQGVLTVLTISCINKNVLLHTEIPESSVHETIDLFENAYDSDLDQGQMEREIEEVIDEWSLLRLEPINLNIATYDDLLRLPGFRPSYARAFLKHRKNVGRFATYLELQSIKGVPQDVWEKAIEFSTLGSPIGRISQSVLNLKYWTPNSTVESISRVKFPVERSVGYRSDIEGKDRVYLGPPVDRYQRITYSSNRVKTGLTMRSGAGALGTWMQPSWKAMSLQIKNVPLLSNLVIGDYRLNWGLGLGMNSSGSFRKGSDLLQLTTKQNSITPHMGSSYKGHHSGLALSFGEKTKLSLWISNRAYTASETDSLTLRWSSSEPYFRTPSETAKRDNLEIESFGLRLNGSLSSVVLGAYAWQMKTDRFVAYTSDYFPELSYRDRTFSIIGADLQWNYRIGSLAMEWALDKGLNPAGIIANELSLSNELTFSTIYRNYSVGFISPFGASLSAWTGKPGNEHGFYTGLELTPKSTIKTILHADHYSSHLPRGNDFYVSKGSDLGFKTSLHFKSKKVELIARQYLKTDEIENIDVIGRSILSQMDTEKFNLRFIIQQDSDARLDWSTRVEWVRVTTTGGKSEQGHQISQDLVWNPYRVLRVQARVAIFSTEGYSSRLYAYEPDVALSSSIPAFQGQGVRNFILAIYRPHPTIETRFKWARVLMPHEYQLGSGNDLIEGNQKTTIHLSLRVRV